MLRTAIAITRRDALLRTAAIVVISAGAATLAGCKERDRGPEVVSLEGKIDDIKDTGQGTGEIVVSYYSEKHKQDVLGTARVTKETEIIINGAVADLSQLKEGERIRGDVLVERVEGNKRYTVKKIFVDRAGQPAPAGG